jgi:histidyl-tRNA synthetase
MIFMATKLTPKGMRDIPPEHMYVREEVFGKIRAIFRSYGYRPLETPAMEYLDTLRAKAGPEADKEIFVIEGGEYGLRFDLTVPLARYAAGTAEHKPFKRYAIDAVWRKEEPQRGRFREFYQADADIIGSASMRCEAELLSLARDVCSAFGFNKPKIMLNNRKILDGVAAKLGIETSARDEVYRVLDKLDKIGEEEVIRLLNEILGGKSGEIVKLMHAKGGNREKLALAAKYSPEGAKELEAILALCDFEIEVDLFLARGLGYYTGPVYEVKLSGDMGTVVAGGRYDNLLGVYGEAAPAAGISVGIARLVTLMEERDKKAEGGRKTDTKVIVAAVKPEFYKNALSLASAFRRDGIACETDLNERNLTKQFEYANALSIPFVAIIGEREAKSGTVTLRDMASGTEEVLKTDAAARKVKGR